MASAANVEEEGGSAASANTTGRTQPATLASLSGDAVLDQIVLAVGGDNMLAAHLMRTRSAILPCFAPYVGAEATAFEAAANARSLQDAWSWPSNHRDAGHFVSDVLRGHARHLVQVHTALIDRARQIVQNSSCTSSSHHNVFNTQISALSEFVESLDLDNIDNIQLDNILEVARNLSKALKHMIFLQGHFRDGYAASGVIPDVHEIRAGCQQEMLNEFCESEGVDLSRLL
mmetsp:Transcript_28610/g.75657  ORF Transcript_28610/g.75657 Transcript_28610/m.75657 type:complete len:231 (-) Transcript_28610:188-880(-)